MGLGPSNLLYGGSPGESRVIPSFSTMQTHGARAGMLRQDLTGRCVGPASCEEDAALTAEDMGISGFMAGQPTPLTLPLPNVP